uniref:DUF3778 domain-containing protein n=1 Tax=Oryza nivara TaxID=4536 RepID=A0A0E0HWQ7_ORYNI
MVAVVGVGASAPRGRRIEVMAVKSSSSKSTKVRWNFRIWMALVVVVVVELSGGGPRRPARVRVCVGGDGVCAVPGTSVAVIEVATVATLPSALRRPSSPFAVPGLAVASFPSVASVLAVAPAGVGMCVAFGGCPLLSHLQPQSKTEVYWQPLKSPIVVGWLVYVLALYFDS